MAHVSLLTPSLVDGLGELMDNPVRLAFPRRGWAKFAWHEAHPPDAAVRRAAEALAAVPGVTWSHAVLEVPQTVWRLDVFHVFLDAAGLTEAFEEDVPVMIGPLSLATAMTMLRDAVDWGLYPWQREAVLHTFGAAPETCGLLLADGMGLGKTRTAIAVAEVFRGLRPGTDVNRGSIRPSVVIAPSFTLDVWRRELLAMGALEGREPEDDLCILRTRNHNDASWDLGAKWIFVHYEIVDAWASRIALRNPLVAIIDEAHWVKNDRTKRGGGVRVATGRAAMTLALTGTPMDNRVGELWHLLTLVTGTGTWGSPLDFRKRYAGAVHNGHGYEDRGPTRVEELRERMAPFYLRRTEADLPAGSLPAFRRTRISAVLEGKHRVDHDALLVGHDLDVLVRAVLEGRAGEDTMRLLTALRQVTGRAKRQATRAYVAALLEVGESVVVFSWEKVNAAYFAAGAVEDVECVADCLTGDVAQAERDAVVERFQGGGFGGSGLMPPALLSATYGVLREGVTLTHAAHVVLHDLDWKFSTLLQAEKRVHRIGQTRPCTAAWAVAEDSFDQVLAKLLMRKAEWLEETLGIDAPAGAAADVDLGALLPEADEMARWAREQLGRWG